jgi:myo-inositol-hexaphosphate 3-phosphohydrolase
VSNHRYEIYHQLRALGITQADAEELRRIAMILHRWSELECGDEYGNAVERDEVTGKPFMTYERGQGPRGQYPIPDREKGALKRLAAIMLKYPTLVEYVQGDPRGAPLYICTEEQIGYADIESVYNRGVAVYK